MKEQKREREQPRVYDDVPEWYKEKLKQEDEEKRKREKPDGGTVIIIQVA